ncbi:DNA ligase [uncultured Pseudacidovorax sp.]|uniref:DNA ligase n=1 Tax=uncultured Pseudacidovorax sp. TaxID=679313 RepID=UPI0025CBE303|nr:DNA ligase [uncultured Pseudacidovorax sp.]
MRRRGLLLAALSVALCAPVWAAPPALMLAEVWRAGMPLDGYWVSEKYDGVRGYWDGQALWTRGGERVAAPAWFTANWPRQPMDGELWAGRGLFEHASGTVRSQTPDDAAWRAMRFMVFDLPAEPGDFDHRLQVLQRLLPIAAIPWLEPVAQERATTADALKRRLDATVRGGGEGLMLHRGSSLYGAGRSADLLKVKPYDDAEAVVLAHLPGQGRHAGRLGALQVRTSEGLVFKLGGGFTDAQRDDPPPIGSTVTYRYNGLTAQGLPRFARFMRVRTDR